MNNSLTSLFLNKSSHCYHGNLFFNLKICKFFWNTAAFQFLKILLLFTFVRNVMLQQKSIPANCTHDSRKLSLRCCNNNSAHERAATGLLEFQFERWHFWKMTFSSKKIYFVFFPKSPFKWFFSRYRRGTLLLSCQFWPILIINFDMYLFFSRNFSSADAFSGCARLHGLPRLSVAFCDLFLKIYCITWRLQWYF